MVIGHSRRFPSSAFSLLVFLVLLIAIHQYALAWDEGFTFQRQEVLRQWFGQLWDPVDGDRGRLISKKVLDEYWPFSREEPDGHGPFYALLSLAGHWISSVVLSPPASYRVGSISLFCLALGCVLGTLRRRWGMLSAILTVGLLASIPRVLPEVCFAAVDGPLYSLALLAWCGFVRAIDSNPSPSSNPSSRSNPSSPTPLPGGERGGRLGFGVALGLAMATKLTGWLLLFPYLVWGVLHCRRGVWLTIFLGGVVALLTAFGLNVGWWPDPVDGISRYFESNLSREQKIPIGIQFLGTHYPFSLPWYNTLVWTVVAMPVGILILGTLGIMVAIRRWRTDFFGMLLVLNWGLLMVVRALPQAPGHDGTRQIIISFGFLTLLAGYGFEAIRQKLFDTKKTWPKIFLLAAIGFGALGESVTSACRYHPYQLSYYSPIVGGLPGAVSLGFEATYYWDSLTPDVLKWIDENTGPDEWILFRNNPISFDYLTRWAKFHVQHHPPPGFDPPPRWFVIQNRPGLFSAADDWLIANKEPAYRKTLFGVPLIEIYSGQDWHEARRKGRK